VAVLGPRVVRKLVLSSCLEVASRLITLSGQALVHRPLVQVKTRVRHELQVTAGLRADQLGAAVLRPAVVIQVLFPP